MAIAITLHILATLLWVGGMFFAYMALRPAAASLLEPPLRLPLWVATFRRFFPWVWIAVIMLPLTGYWMVFYVFGGMRYVGLHVHFMQGLGWLMILIYLYVFFGPYRALKTAVTTQDWPAGGQALARIRRMVGINLLLGIAITIIATGGAYVGGLLVALTDP